MAVPRPPRPRSVPRGYDVLAYDSRAHGASGGEYCTYGYHERHDLSRALDAVGAHDAILIGVSLGGAVALQAAAIEPRVKGVIAVAPFADLASIVRDRSPWFATEADRAAALAGAGRLAGFDPNEASPVRAAPRITVPVLLIHGARDGKTPPEHSRRIFRALGDPKELCIIASAGHDDILARAGTWRVIECWLSARDGP
jgi:pimeloyl-ACP methyl ester carboxylesterase